MVEELHQHWHALSNELLVVSLTLELCGSADKLQEEQFQEIQEMLTLAIRHLRESRQVIEYLDTTLVEEHSPLTLVVDNLQRGKQVHSLKKLSSMIECPNCNYGLLPDTNCGRHAKRIG
jgi:hypothetical protein